MKNIPEIRYDNNIATLYVDEKPFFAKAGEVHNSSASSLSYMESRVWPALIGLNMNCVLVPVYWEKLEPAEGNFDFTLVDGLIDQARAHSMHLIFLWFGLWKNAESMYVPAWIKTDPKTYFLVRKVNGEAIHTVSPLCDAAVQKDATAFAVLLSHLKKVDEEKSTVVAVQVENEVGILGTACDYSDAAREAFAGEIPAKMKELYGCAGSWREAFGEDAPEYFMAWYFAKAVETIAQAGKKEYPLPLYVNNWLYQYPWYPGSYPSGGPVLKVQKIWKKAAPSLFSVGPDIYVPYVKQIIDDYAGENALIIPEIRNDATSASYCLYAFAKHNAICYAPFGIEDLFLDPDQIEKLPMEVMAALNIDPSAMDTTNSLRYLSQAYGLIRDLEPLLLKYRGSGRIHAFLKGSETDYGTLLRGKAYDLRISYDPKVMAKPLSCGVIFELDEDRFLIAGSRFGIEFAVKEGENLHASYVKLEEGCIQEGEWIPCRQLNGDEMMRLKFGDDFTCLMAQMYQY